MLLLSLFSLSASALFSFIFSYFIFYIYFIINKNLLYRVQGVWQALLLRQPDEGLYFLIMVVMNNIK